MPLSALERAAASKVLYSRFSDCAMVVKNFLRRWSTMDITEENAILFEEHLMGVQALCSSKQRQLLEGLSRHSTREDFSARYGKLLNQR